MSLSPILKWVGGKAQILPTVMDVFPRQMKNYHEPFVGGGSILFALLTYRKMGLIRIEGNVYATDLNQPLIRFFKILQRQPQELLAETEKLIAEWKKSKGTTILRTPTNMQEAQTSPESYYFWIRGRFNTLPPEQKETATAAAMFLFLNKTGFRGLYREGPHGINVPYGNYKNPKIINRAHFLEVSELLQGVLFECIRYDDALARVQEGDFIYLDPPYAQIKETSFVGYLTEGFDNNEQEKLFTTVKGFAAKKARFLMSNADVDLVKKAFPSPPYQVHTITAKRAIHPKKPGSKTQELLILSPVVAASPSH